MSEKNATDLEEPIAITYAELISKYLNARKASTHANASSAMKFWLKGLEKSDGDMVGSELSDETTFKNKVEEHIAAYTKAILKRTKKDAVADSTIWNRTCLLNDIRDYFLTLGEKGNHAEASFAQTLRTLIENSKLLQKDVARNVGISKPTLSRWLGGRRAPSAPHRETIRLLEALFHVPEGTLSDKIPYWFGDAVTDSIGLDQTPYRKHLRRQTQSSYALRSLTAQLSEVFDMLVDHKMKESIMDPSCKLYDQPGLWHSEATAAMVLEAFKRFFGFLNLPKIDPAAPRPDTIKKETAQYVECRGLGMSIAELSFAHLTDAQLINLFVDFLAKRTIDGRKNVGHATFVGSVISLLQPGYGFFRSHPQLGAQLLKPIADPDPQMRQIKWHEWLDKNLITMREIKRSISSRIRKDNYVSRKPGEPIKDLLALRSGIYDALVAAIESAIRKLPRKAQPKLCATMARDVVLAILLTEEPLRQKHFRLMEIDKHLVKRADGTWWCIWPSEIFKNQGTNNMGRETMLPPKWYPILEEYLQDWRPTLLGANETSFVVRARITGAKQDPSAPVSTGSLYNMVYQFTRRHLKQVCAIGPHAFRDLAVTDYLSKYPNDWAGAAALIGDTESTIRSHYSHLEQKDHLDRAMKNRRNGKSDSNPLQEENKRLQEENIRLTQELKRRERGGGSR